MGIGIVIQKDHVQLISTLDEVKQVCMQIVDLIPQKDIQAVWNEANETDTVTLYHGTTSAYLNNIFQQGIMPREKSEIDNWQDNQSNGRVVYLTNKWHYFYAVNTTAVYLDKVSEEHVEDRAFASFPCYVECKVPKSLLIMDEDFIYTNYVKQKVRVAKRKHQDLMMAGDECLAQFGTAGVIGGVPPSAIKSFTILGNTKLFSDSDSQYMKDYHSWQEGKGKGKLKLRDLMKIEESTYDNATWFMDQFSGPPVIKKVFLNPITDKIAIEATNTKVGQR